MRETHGRCVWSVDDVVPVTWLTDADFDVRTSLNGAGNDDNLCARIFTGRFHTASVQSVNQNTFVDFNAYRHVL